MHNSSMIHRVIISRLVYKQLLSKQSSNQQIDVPIEQKEKLKLTEFDKKQLQRLRKIEMRAKKKSSEIRRLFNQIDDALSSKHDKIEILQKLRNKVLFYELELFTGLNVNNDAKRHQMYEQMIEIMQNNQIPEKHKVNIIKLTLLKEIDEKNGDFQFVCHELDQSNMLVSLLKEVRETIFYLKNYFARCFQKIKQFCDWALGLITKWL